VFQWLKQYASDPNATTVFVFKLEYTNTASSKMVQDILSALEKIKGVTITWYYHADDEDMEAMAMNLLNWLRFRLHSKRTSCGGQLSCISIILTIWP